jgi:hypothetical protein
MTNRLCAYKTKTNHDAFFIYLRLRIFNVVEHASLVVITQCSVCHFFVKATESTYC